MKNILCLFFFLFFIRIMPSQAQPYDIFAKANRLYSEAKFKEAIDNYELILNGGYEGGSLFYNLGNACFKIGAVGRAILNYEKARKFIPRDPDLNANLNYAFKKAELAPKRCGLFLRLSMFFTSWELGFFLFFCYYLIVIISGAGFFMKRISGGIKCAFLTLTVMLLFVSSFFMNNLYNNFVSARGIILRDGIGCRFEPNMKSTVFFRLNEGDSVAIYDKNNEWVRVEREDGSVGWIPQEAVGVI